MANENITNISSNKSLLRSGIYQSPQERTCLSIIYPKEVPNEFILHWKNPEGQSGCENHISGEVVCVSEKLCLYKIEDEIVDSIKILSNHSFIFADRTRYFLEKELK